MVVTNHAKKRMKKRVGTSCKNYDKIAQKAIDDGIRHEETKGNLCKWLDKLFLSHGVGANMRIYHQKVFIFTKEYVLVTVIDVPSNLLNAVNKISKRKSMKDSDNNEKQL